MSAEAYIWTSPLRAGGRPCIGGTGVTVWTVALRVWGGEAIKHLATDYEVRRLDILLACWHRARYGGEMWERRWGDWARRASPRLCAGDAGACPDPPTVDAGSRKP